MKKIFITGFPGTGKSTIGYKLHNRGIKVIDVDDVPHLCSWVDKKSGEKADKTNPDIDYIETHTYVCDADMLMELINQSGDPVVVFGCVSNNIKLFPFFDKIFLLQCSTETLKERLTTRSTNIFGKDQKVQKMLLDSEKSFDEEMIKAGATPINTDGEMDLIIQNIINMIESN